MIIKKLNECIEFLANDHSHLKVILHPDHDPVEMKASLAYAVIKPGETSLPHILTTTEIYYILNGSGQMVIGNEKSFVEKDQVIYIPPNHKQYISNTGQDDLCFLCIVDPAWKEENETILSDMKNTHG